VWSFETAYDKHCIYSTSHLHILVQTDFDLLLSVCHCQTVPQKIKPREVLLSRCHFFVCHNSTPMKDQTKKNGVTQQTLTSHAFVHRLNQTVTIYWQLAFLYGVLMGTNSSLTCLRCTNNCQINDPLPTRTACTATQLAVQVSWPPQLRKTFRFWNGQLGCLSSSPGTVQTPISHTAELNLHPIVRGEISH
jgi:hypothetical protein